MTEQPAHDNQSEEIFRSFSIWNLFPSTILMVSVILAGSISNCLILYWLYKTKIGMPSVNPVLVAISVKNMLAICSCLPMALVMLHNPSVISKMICMFHENITYATLFSGLLYPAVLAMVRYDQVVRPQHRWLEGVRTYCLLVFVTLLSIILGLQAQLQGDTHGCHMWSEIVDPVVKVYLYALCACVLFSILLMVGSYLGIYSHAKTRVANGVQPRPVTDKAEASGINGGEVAAASDVAPASTRAAPNNLDPLRRKMNVAIIKPMFWVVGVTLLCWAPWVILNAIKISEAETGDAEVRILALSIVYIPVASDPIIFIVFSSRGRRALRQALHTSLCCVNTNPNPIAVHTTRFDPSMM